MKQLIEDLISAMEYHVEQTRPIHSTTVALQAAREALKTMPTPLVCDCNQGQVCHVCDPITPPAQPAPVREPVAWMDASGDIYKHDLWPDWNPPHTPLYTAPPAAQRQWVGLTDDEILEAAGIDGADTWLFETAYAIEAKLKEKNT
jgi:hypothetical protein